MEESYLNCIIVKDKKPNNIDLLLGFFIGN